MLEGIKKASSLFGEYARDERAAISPMMVFMLIPLCGIMALAGEVSFWFMTQRALQNAADSAALAAAANNDFVNTDTDSSGNVRYRYQNEALAVAKTYGFANGVNNITITATREAPCVAPATEPACYRVNVRRDVPLYLTQIVGYQGDATHDGRFSKIVSSEAVAKAPSSSFDACIIGLTASGAGISLAGTATGFNTCDLVSNAQVKCSSVDVGSIYAASVQACGGESFSPLTETYDDPYASMDWSTLPRSPCTPTPLHLYTNWSTPYVMCASTRKLLGPVNITAANAQIIVVGQTIDLNGFNLQTSGSGSTTIIFTASTATTTVPKWFENSAKSKPSAIAIAAPTASGAAYRNFAIIGDPTRTVTDSTVLGDYKHGTEEFTMNILGVVYAPRTDITADGNVRSDLNSYTCISIIANSFSSNGGKLTNSPLSECSSAGIDPPNVPFARTALVQ